MWALLLRLLHVLSSNNYIIPVHIQSYSSPYPINMHIKLSPRSLLLYSRCITLEARCVSWGPLWWWLDFGTFLMVCPPGCIFLKWWKLERSLRKNWQLSWKLLIRRLCLRTGIRDRPTCRKCRWGRCWSGRECRNLFGWRWRWPSASTDWISAY